MSYVSGKFVWFEHVSNDAGKARAFYSALVGWVVHDMPMGDQTYGMIMNGGMARENGIGGFRTATAGMPNHWISYLSVADVDKAHAQAVAAGARSMMEPMAMGPGRASGITDPTGAMLALWKGGEGDPADTEKTPFGGWFWNELHSTDAKAALAFYKQAFGYSVDSQAMGPDMTYHVLKSADGKMRGGLMQANPAMTMPSNWLPYIHVKDCDAAVATANKLGAMAIVMPPTDIPGVGRSSVLIDPTGVAIGIIKGAAA
jgi:predicted enzyme related to lactoylglutathione lyase